MSALDTLDSYLDPQDDGAGGGNDLAALATAIRGVESGGNRNAVSKQNARGSMQIMPATFQQYARPGEDFSNDDDRTRAALRKLADDYAHFGGDLRKTAAAYIGGRGGILPDGSLRDDVHDAEGTSPRKYADMILSRMGRGGAMPGAPGSQAAQGSPDLADEILAAGLAAKPPAPEPQGAGFMRTAGDVGIKLAQGAVDLGQSVVGLGNLATGGLAGKAMRAIGYDPEATNAALGEGLSDSQKAADAKVQEADGFVDSIIASLENPRAILGGIAESAPGMFAGMGATSALAARMGVKAALATTEGRFAAQLARDAGKTEAQAAAAALKTTAGKSAADAAIEANSTRLLATGSGVEGAQSAGQIADQAQGKGRDYTDYALPSLTAGALTAGIGLGAGRLFGDAATDMATGAHTLKGSRLAKIGKEAFSEGVAEEAPQSAQEQYFTNVAEGEPDRMKGVGNAAGSGLVVGGVQGGAMAGFHGNHKPPATAAAPAQTPAQTPVQTPATQDPAAAAPGAPGAPPALPALPADAGPLARANHAAAVAQAQRRDDAAAAFGSQNPADARAAAQTEVQRQVDAANATPRNEFEVVPTGKPEDDTVNADAADLAQQEYAQQWEANDAGMGVMRDADAAERMNQQRDAAEQARQRAAEQAQAVAESRQAEQQALQERLRVAGDLGQQASDRRADYLRTERQRRESEMADVHGRLDAEQAVKSRNARMDVLDQVLTKLGDAAPERKLAAFTAQLRREGYRNLAPTTEELAHIERHSALDQAFAKPYEVYSAPNELVDAVPERKPAAAPVAKSQPPATPTLPAELVPLAQQAKDGTAFWKALNKAGVPTGHSVREPLMKAFKAFVKNGRKVLREGQPGAADEEHAAEEGSARAEPTAEPLKEKHAPVDVMHDAARAHDAPENAAIKQAWSRANFGTNADGSPRRLTHDHFEAWHDGGGVSPDVGSHYDAHGIAKSNPLGNLLNILTHGINPNRQFDSAPLVPRKGDSAGVGAGLGSANGAYKDGPFILVSARDGTLKDGIQTVLVSDHVAGVIPALEARFPGVDFVPYSQAQEVLGRGEEARAGAAPAVDAQAAPKDGFIAGPGNTRVRISQHVKRSNVLDPEADIGAFTYEVRNGEGDRSPLTMVLSKDGKLVERRMVIDANNKSNGTAWIPPSEQSAAVVRRLLEQRAKTEIGSPERKAIDAQIAAHVKESGVAEPTHPQADQEFNDAVSYAVYSATHNTRLQEDDVPLTADDLDFELEAMLGNAERGKLTPEQFAQSPLGQRIDTTTLMLLNKAIRSHGPVVVIKALIARVDVLKSAAKPAADTASDLAGDKIDKEWTEFAPDSGTLGIPRADMPQIKAEHRGALTQFLKARGISHTEEEVLPSTLKATQREFSHAKVEQAKAHQGGDRAILVSSDNRILDGHHQWLANLEDDRPIRVLRFDAPIRELMAEAKEFPSAELAEGAPAQAADQGGDANANRLAKLRQEIADIEQHIKRGTVPPWFRNDGQITGEDILHVVDPSGDNLGLDDIAPQIEDMRADPRGIRAAFWDIVKKPMLESRKDMVASIEDGSYVHGQALNRKVDGSDGLQGLHELLDNDVAPAGAKVTEGASVSAEPAAEAQPARPSRNSEAWRNEGKTPEQLIEDRAEALGGELAGQVAEEAKEPDFSAKELPQAVAQWAEDGHVPADLLRQALLAALGRFDIKKGALAKIRYALSPIKAGTKPAPNPSIPRSSSDAVNEFIDGKRDTPPTLEEVAAEQADAKPEAPAVDPLDAELNDALAHLGQVLGDIMPGKSSMVPTKYKAGDLLPALSKVIELLVRKGFRTFSAAVGGSAKAMRGNPAVAPHVDQISARRWKAAYNAIAEDHEGTDSENVVAAMPDDQVMRLVAAPAAPSAETTTKLDELITSSEARIAELKRLQEQAKATHNAWVYDKQIADAESTLQQYREARERQAPAKVNLKSAATGEILHAEDGTLYRIEGIDIERNKIRTTRNPDMLSEKVVLMDQDRYNRLVEEDARVREAAQPAAETTPAPTEVREPATLDEFIGDVDAGYRAHFDYAGAHGSTVWIEKTDKGWVVKSMEDGEKTIYTKGGATPAGGWDKVAALKAAERLATHRFTEWKPLVEPAATEDAQRNEQAASTYEQRNAERVAAIDKAKTADDLDRIIADEHGDGERHFEGTNNVERNVRMRKFQLEREAEKAAEQARYEAGEWVQVPDFRSGSPSVARQEAEERRKADPDNEYRTNEWADAHWVEKRRRQATPPPAAPAKPELTRQQLNGLSVKVMTDAQLLRALKELPKRADPIAKEMRRRGLSAKSDAAADKSENPAQAPAAADDKPALLEELREKLADLSDRAFAAGDGNLSGRIAGFTVGMRDDDANLTRAWVDDVVAEREKMVKRAEKAHQGAAPLAQPAPIDNTQAAATATSTKEPSNDSTPAADPPALDHAVDQGQRPAGSSTPARGAELPRDGAGRADDGRLREPGGRAEGADDAREDLGHGRGDEAVSDRPHGDLAAGGRGLSADFRPAPGGLTREGSWFDTASRNIDLIELARKIEAEGRAATPEEQEQLSKYVGFGASAIRNVLFPVPPSYSKQQDPHRLIWPSLIHQANWRALAERLETLPPDWQRSVLQSSQYAHYTSENMIRSIWSAVQRLGFTGGKVFEPGMGIGSFSMLMPDSVHATSSYTGVEFDGPTALIARLLSPQQNALHADFIKRKFPKDFFDLAIGNPPFSQTKIYGDPDYEKHGFMIHDFFFAKALDRVRPGGLLAFVTSKGTMDKQSDKARNFLAARADLVGAIRLPSTAFEGNAGTSVVTDVIFLRKRAPGDAPAGANWQNTATVDTKDGPVVVNEYYAAHPDMVLGQNRISGNMDDEGRRVNSNGRGGEQYTVVSYDKTPEELDAKFAAAVERLPENVYSVLNQSAASAAKETAKVDFDPRVKREGVVYLADDGTLMRVEQGVGHPLGDAMKMTDKDHAWFKGYVGLRDLVQDARHAQVTDGDWKASLGKLNKAYDAFRKEHGPINDFRVQTRKSTDEQGNVIETESRVFKNRRRFREDYDSAILTQLETINESGEIVKSPFLEGRTIGVPATAEVKTIGDALAVSLNNTGRLDLDDVGRRIGMSRDEAIEALGKQVYKTPAGEWQLADEYLSGDVVAKLEEAEQAMRLDESLARNVEALKEAQPDKLGPSQISAKLGASWIPESHVNAFAEEIEAGKVTFDPITETWQVDGGNVRSGRRAGAEYGTAKRSPSELLEALLNSRAVKVAYDSSAGKELAGKTDPTATTAANQAVKKIKDKFKGWVWTDTDRATELVDIYNTRFNNIAPRKFDGAHLTLPGVSLRFKLHPHQLRAIWRIIQTGDTYLAHAVGAGKTIEMIAAGMEQKRLGLINKPMYVVPNHMLEQFSNEFMELYPLANIMVADDENFSAERRKAFVANATLNKPDAVIITHDAFQRIGVKEESVAPIRDEILADLEYELEQTAKGHDTRVRRSQLEQQIEAVNQRFDRIIGAGGKDSTIKFEDIGTDFIFADEAHAYRKLDFHTAQQIKGIDPNGSKRALDMYVKTRWLEQQRPGRAMVFASGTPVTNTMGELYTIMRYFSPQELDRGGISTFDAWARQFGEVAPALEPNAAGKYELVERFAKFDNVPELMSRVRQFMDVLTSDHLGALVKRPDLEGGKPNLNMVAPSEALQAYMEGELARRLEISKAWKPSKEEPNNPDPIVAIITDGRFAALDPRFFGGKLGPEGSIITDMGDKVVANYHATRDNVYLDKNGQPEPIKGSTQLVFYNLGFGEQSMRNRGFDARAAFTKRLTDGGIPRNQIAWFDDANTDAKKEAVFKDMRSGKLAVLIGSAKKMGTGVNVQKRLIKLHYQDPPWFPSDVEQPHGRIIRQGNQNSTVGIEWYSTKGTYQSTMWQMVARKQRFIDQAFTGDKNIRSMEDLGEASLFEQAAAVASGDPRALQLAGLKQDVERFERLQTAHASEQISVRTALHSAEWQVESATKRISAYSKAFQLIGERRFEFSGGMVGKQRFDKQGEFGQALKDAFNDIAAGGMIVVARPVASLGDHVTLSMTANLNDKNKLESYSLHVHVGAVTQRVVNAESLNETVDAGGLVRKVINQVNGIEPELRDARGSLKAGETDVTRLRKKVGAPFEYQQEMAEKYGDLKRLEEELRAEGQAKPAAAAAVAAPVAMNEDGTTPDDGADAATPGMNPLRKADGSYLRQDPVDDVMNSVRADPPNSAGNGSAVFDEEGHPLENPYYSREEAQRAQPKKRFVGGSLNEWHQAKYGTKMPWPVPDELKAEHMAKQAEYLRDKEDGYAMVEAENAASEQSTEQDVTAHGRVDDRTPALGFDRNFSKPFRDWFGDSKITNQDGTPKVVYHGTLSPVEGAMRAGEQAHSAGIFFTDSPRIASDVYAGGARGFDLAPVKEKLDAMGFGATNPDDAVLEAAQKWADKVHEQNRDLDLTPEDDGSSYADQIVWMLENAIADGNEDKASAVASVLGVSITAPLEGGNVVPVYLRMRDPLYVDGTGLSFDDGEQEHWIAQAKAEGKDGVVIRNYSDGGFGPIDNYRPAGRHTVHIVFDPAQVKSATGNSGAFDPANPDILASRAAPVNETRRQLLVAAAAAALAPNAKAGDVSIGKARAIDPKVLSQRVAPGIEKVLRDGQASGTTSLNGIKALRQAMKLIALTGPKELRALAAQVEKLLPATGSLMLTVDDTRRMNVHGVVSLAPVLHMQLFTAEGRTGLTYETLIHETMHVAVAARYRSLSVGVVRGNDKLLGLSAPAAAKALEQFSAVWEEFRAATAGEKFANRELAVAIDEARGDPDEFFVRTLTDPLLQQYMAGKRYEGKTLWERFKDWVKTSLFGFGSESGTAPSWLDAALAASGDVVDAMGGDSADFARMKAISNYQAKAQHSVARVQEDSPEFKAWFGDSKVVDPDTGAPLVVYHGTNKDFSVFKNRYANKGWEMFSTDPRYSNGFAGSPGGNVMPVYLSMQNPLDLTHLPAKRGDVRNKLIKALERAGVEFDPAGLLHERDLYQIVNMAGHQTNFAEAVQAAGYDGIIMPDVLEGMAPEGAESEDLHATTYIVFKPGQIKSAVGNDGNFDPNNPNIMRNRAANDSVAAANESPLTRAARRRFDQVMAEAENWLQSNGMTAGLLGLEPRLAMDSLDMTMGFTKKDLSEKVKEQGRAIWDRANAAYKNLAQRGGELEAGPDTMFSRAAPAEGAGGLANALANAATSTKDIKLWAGYKVGDFLDNTNKVGWWHTTIGTMKYLAFKHPAFRPVYEAVQNFLGDVSRYATMAGELAPRLMPQLEDFKDIFGANRKKAVSAEDTRAIATPIFEGTKDWARDAHGQPVLVADLRTQAEALSPDQKAQILLHKGELDDQQYKAWRALPPDTHDAAVANRFEATQLQPGVVWTDAELRSMFDLNDSQIALYREFRAAVDKSLTNLTISEMARMAGKTDGVLVAQAVAMPDLQGAAAVLRDHYVSLARLHPDQADMHLATAKQIMNLADKGQKLIDRGYAPLQRFGQYTVYMEEEGEPPYFGMYETAADAAQAARTMKEKFPRAFVRQGTMSQEEYKLFAGVSPETVELFGSMLGLGGDADAADHAYQKYLQLTKANRSAMKRMIHRKGTAGYSEDVGRVLASFLYSNARLTSSNLHTGEIDEGVNEIPKEQGQLKDQAVALRQHVRDPQSGGTFLSGLMFAQFLGGSVASAAVNFTQPVMTSLPYLSQWGGLAKAGSRLMAAVRDARKDSTGDAALDAAMEKHKDVLEPQEVHYMQAQAAGKATLRAGDGTKAGDARAKASNTMAAVRLAWGKLFAKAEETNRRITFIAAYRTAMEQGNLGDAGKFAAQAVKDTQFVANAGNKMAWGRNPVGGLLLTFKGFSVQYLEMLGKMAFAGAPGSPERAAGRRAVLYAMAVMLMMAGSRGLPFEQDIEAVIDGLLQRMGYNFSSKRAMQAFLADKLGNGGAAFATSGVSGLPGMPFDMAGRLGAGHLIPGIGALRKKASYTSDVAEIAGPAADLVKRGFTAAGKAVGGDLAGAALDLSPAAVRNAAQGADMLRTGTYRDARGYIVNQTTPAEALLKMGGFQPSSTASVQDAKGQALDMIAQSRMRSNEIAEHWAQGRANHDEAMVNEARAMRDDWNEKNPEAKVNISMPGIMHRVQAMRQDALARTQKTAGKALKAAVRRELSEVRD